MLSLEAWRRGLNVIFVKNINNFKINSKDTIHSFTHSTLKTCNTSIRAHEICLNKEITKKYLLKEGIGVPRGKRFDTSSFEEDIINFAELVGFPVVLKPTSGQKGIGVFSYITNVDSLRKYLRFLMKDLNIKDIILEECINGVDLRLYVIDGKVVAALKRIPAHITGNGKDTIRKLIKIKNIERKNNPFLATSLIEYDHEIKDYIQTLGYNLNSIPEKGERIYLRRKCNISAGGDSEDVTEEIAEQVKEIAIRSVGAIPGLQHGGVDVIYNIGTKGRTIVVNEVNSIADIGMHLFPIKGKPRDVSSALIDYYFPESIPKKGKNKNLFYDRRSAIYALEKEPKTEYILPTAPDYTVVSKEINLSVVVRGVGLRKRLKSKALSLNLSGHAENVRAGKLRIVIAGEESKIQTFINFCKTGAEKYGVKEVLVSDYFNPIIFGFNNKNGIVVTNVIKTFQKVILILPSGIVRLLKKKILPYIPMRIVNIYSNI